MTAFNTPLTGTDAQSFRRGATAGFMASLLLAAAIALAWAVGTWVTAPAPAAPAVPVVNDGAPATEINAENPYVRGSRIAY